MRITAYYRVSTKEQEDSGHGLNAQRDQVASYAAQHDAHILQEFTEQETGKMNDRPQLAAALEFCRLTRSTLVIARLDRLSRKVAFIANLMDAGVEFLALDVPHRSPFELHIRAALAEEEARKISERTKAALKAAKSRGVKLGNPCPSSDTRRAIEARQAQLSAFYPRIWAIVEPMAQGGASLRAIARELNARGIAPVQGKHWHPTSVSRLINRFDDVKTS